jgi:hypothetical protein
LPKSAGATANSTGTSTTVASRASTAECPPTTDSLYIYNYFSSAHVTNHSGRYDSGSWGYSFDYTRNCKVLPITKVLIKDNFAVRETTTRSINLYFDTKISNCWQVARVSGYGQSEWSNQVCYAAPEVIAPSPTQTPINIASSLKGKVPKGVKGAQCFNGYRTKDRTIRACANHFGRDYWIFKPFTVGFKKAYVPSIPLASYGSASGKCVGICYGVPSTVNGLPRNTYVSGYFRKDGTYVGPYTRSKP